MVLHWAFADSGDWYGYMIACEIAPIKTARRTFADDLAALMAKYGSAEAIPDDDILDLPTLSGYQEPSEVVMGIECDGVTLITRQPGRWKLKVAAPVEHEAEPQNRLEAYALVHYRDVEPDWDDLVGYASQVGVWGRARPQGPPALDSWQ